MLHNSRSCPSLQLTSQLDSRFHGPHLSSKSPVKDKNLNRIFANIGGTIGLGKALKKPVQWYFDPYVGNRPVNRLILGQRAGDI